MKIIDEKGRLFGKINVIDFLVILFLLGITPMFYFGYRLFKKSSPVIKKVEVLVPLDVCAVFKNLDPETVKLISEGDKELDKEGKVMGEILEAGKVESNFISIKLNETDTITKEDSQRKQIILRMRLMVRVDGNDVFYKENKVKIGADIAFKTNKYEIKGTVIPETAEQEEIFGSKLTPINLDILFKNLSPEVANLISAGDFEVDKNGDTIAKVLRVASIEPYTYKIDLGGNNYISKVDPQKKQVQAKIEIMGEVEGSTFYFKGERIALDSQISLNTNKYRIDGIVVREPMPVKSLNRLPLALDILFKNLSPEVANLISAGDFEVDKNGDTIAKVLRVASIEPYTYKIDLAEDTKVDPQKKQVQAKIEIMGEVEGSTFYFKGERIALDSQISLNTNKYRIDGIVVREPVPVKKVEKQWLLLKVKFTGLIPELVNAISKGDEERDGSGDLIARVDSVVTVEPSKITILSLNKEELTIAEDPTNKDIVLLIYAPCIKAQKIVLFKETPVKIGSIVLFQTSKYDIVGKILEIKEAEN